MKIGKTLKYLLSAALAVVLVWFSFREVRWEDFIAGIKACRWEYVLMSMAAGVMAFWLRALRWHGLIIPIDPLIKRRTVFNAVNIGYIANFVFPRIGEFVRCAVITGNSKGPAPKESLKEEADKKDSAPKESAENISGQRKASYDKVLGTVVLERVWDMITMAAFIVILLVFKWDRFGAFFRDKIFVPAVGRFSYGIWLLAAAICLLSILSVYLVRRFREKNAICKKVYSFISGIVQGFSSFLRMKNKMSFLFYTLAIWSMYWLMSFATMSAMPALDALNLTDAMFLMLAGSLGWVVPVPGGFGAFHFIVSLALSAIYGIPTGLGIIFATLSHESQAVTMAVCGTASYLDETFKK